MGETRLTEFQRAQDSNYQQLYRLGQALSLPPDTVTALYDQRKQAEELARQWRADRNLSPEERSLRFSGLREQLDDDLRSTLGQTNYDFFRRQGPGQWLDGLR